MRKDVGARESWFRLIMPEDKNGIRESMCLTCSRDGNLRDAGVVHRQNDARVVNEDSNGFRYRGDAGNNRFKTTGSEMIEVIMDPTVVGVVEILPIEDRVLIGIEVIEELDEIKAFEQST
ncbi:hypothetical protein TNCV_2056621 [Trichonephila clavipes]|nr:hypothetical protein TNCV_2056621 [Trichonephila clavipes]